ncbi:hypothetical protein MEO40_16940 [Dolichospermum sp. ST_sed1]|nr:hypothetical protein [Dolichospermum sp. ST_sed1]MDD1425841.1 hypothetical protein [Dolichospermum sp. ST_sed9]MDD1432775.1 hypothetical protein [Dolichospermum sp. ST_sed6]MDD1437183.1 hypothetical protein [Dolichospermum sp. ST_sed10]MDD1441502.1 hypothetical protein [Dolichospermum sp. ST_sed3]MDD1447487.1 hypothetical protein [Dolichospermum sp. ST_sed8]MDD1455342.1 hypothetical protein [Dolichospermum sp. ST_sed7]MDD1461637.1 hypothetical protein [Dolichospermum sp. ST_sed2]MDD14668
MTNIYNTQELIQILATERQACLKGDRLKLDITVAINPVIDPFVRTDGFQKFTAYQDFKASIHEYQRENQVSGIIWKDMTIKGKNLHYPEIDAELIALESDLKILKSTKDTILEFWYLVTAEMDLYLSFSNGKQHQQVIKVDVERITQRTEWATLLKWENPNFLEIILQLGWGQPQEAAYKRGRPLAGSEFIHAVKPGCHPIG